MQYDIFRYPGILMALLLSLTINAQDVDNNQQGIFSGSYPETGAWFAMDDSNTGFFLDIQNGAVGGAYFGFDDDGDNVWLLFSGQLEQLDTTGTFDWTLDAPLRQGANGGCILNCNDDQNPPHNSTAVGQIRINFTGRSTGVFSVDGSQFTPIIPLYFGTSAIISELPTGLFAQPDVAGTWAVAISTMVTDTEGNILEFEAADEAGIIQFDEQEVRTGEPGTPPLAQGVTMVTNNRLLRAHPVFPDGSSLSCVYFEPSTEPPVTPLIECIIFGSLITTPPTTTITREIPIHLMSDSRFVAFIRDSADPVDGVLPPLVRIEGFRVGYD